MALTLEDIRKQLLDETPEQWPVLLKLAEARMAEGGFQHLRDFIVTPYLRGGLGISLERAKALLYFNPAYKHHADKLAKRIGVAELAAEVEPANPAIGNETSASYKKENVTSRRGNSAAYRIAKLKRDHPAIAQRLEAGEFKFVSEAERAAGIRGGRMTPEEKVWRAYERLSPDEQERHRRKLDAH